MLIRVSLRTTPIQDNPLRQFERNKLSTYPRNWNVAVSSQRIAKVAGSISCVGSVYVPFSDEGGNVYVIVLVASA